MRYDQGKPRHIKQKIKLNKKTCKYSKTAVGVLRHKLGLISATLNLLFIIKLSYVC